ncbi:hypothetical protein SAMN05421863_100912 [Nitrosomonas communis]|uniref:Uncharacterized protein n=1 Tax=Nitrosomonas communis TaxID=44574 RepID=A0A1I4M8S8_9PROT|nr:hypothetical protein SAMN05421863_100912 [Nitrosomonas communis]
MNLIIISKNKLEHNIYENFNKNHPIDIIKFVICKITPMG